MKRRFSWCTVAAVLVLLFVTTEGLRGQNAQVEDHKTHDVAQRGALKFNPKIVEESTTVSTSLPSRPRSNRDRSTQSRGPSNSEKHDESTTLRSFIHSGAKSEHNRRSNGRSTKTTEKTNVPVPTVTHGDSNNFRRKSSNFEPTISRRQDTHVSERDDSILRRTSNRRSTNAETTERLDNRGPSVFTATTDNTRSRTGRKIQTTYTSKEIKSQVPSSRRFNEKRNEEGAETTTIASRRNRSRTETIERSTRSDGSKVNGKEENSTTRRGQDVLSASESVRVDIPLEVDSTVNPLSNVHSQNEHSRQSQRIISRRSDDKETLKTNVKDSRVNSDRTKSRGRSNDSESSASGSRNNSRRGSSRFNDSVTTEASEQTTSSRRNAGSKDRERSRNSEVKSRNPANESRSRPRGRNLDIGAKSNSQISSGQDLRRRSSSSDRNTERRSRVSDSRSKASENRILDQETRGRSRNRQRVDVATPLSTDTTTTIAPDTTQTEVVTVYNQPETMITTIKAITPAPTVPSATRTTTRTSTTTITSNEGSTRSRGRGRGGNSQGRKAGKEDFFNHGLGFRGRKVSPEGTPGDSRRPGTSKNDSQSRGNPGWTLRRRPGYANKTETSTKTIVPVTKDQTNEVIPSNEQLTSTEVITTIETLTTTARRGPKKQQTTEESTTEATTVAKTTRRGNKFYDKSSTFAAGKGTTDTVESDNYPPEFKARLSQLKNTSVKIPVPKTTAKTPSEEQMEDIFGRRLTAGERALNLDDLEQAASENVLSTDLTLLTNPLMSLIDAEMRHVKNSAAAALFAERSRMKLELARRLVKPELNIEDNDLVPTTATTVSKPRPTEIPVVDESKKVAKVAEPGVSGRKGSTETSENQDGNDSKLFRLRKGLDESSKVASTTRSSGLKKGRIISERMVTSISVEEATKGIETTTKPYESTKPSVNTIAAEEAAATTIDSTRIRLPGSRVGKKSKEERYTTSKSVKVHSTRGRVAEKTNSNVTIKPKKSYSHQSRGSKTTEESMTIDNDPTTTVKPRKSYSSSRNDKHSAEQRKSKTTQQRDTTKKPRLINNVSKTSFQPRYHKRTKQKSLENEVVEHTTETSSSSSLATSRYFKKKAEVKTFDKLKVATTEGTVTQTRKQEYRPRTATYRRHSEVPTTLLETSTKVDGAGVAITPKTSRYHASVKSSTTARSVAQEPLVNLKIANDSTQQPLGITGSSNGDTGNTNIFNPTRSVFVTANNNTLLEQLRSTVAPLLSSLGNKSPVFAGAYKNVNSANSTPRITPNGSPPRFSARYKGAELFVRKPNNIYQPTVPSITSSSTTPVTPVESSGSVPPIDVSSPGEPRFLTFYHAVETASIRNEQPQDNASAQRQEQVAGVAQVDSNAPALSGNNSNNDTTSPTVATASPQTPDTTVNTIQDSTLTPRLSEDAENSVPAVTTEAPGSENPSTTDVTTSTELSSTSEPVSTGIDSISTTQQVSDGIDSMSTTEQTSTSTESSATEQTSTSTESSATEQTSTSTESSATEQTSTSTESSSMEQTTMGGDVEASTGGADAEDNSIFSRISENSRNLILETTTPASQDVTSSVPSSTISTMDTTTMNSGVDSSTGEPETSSSTVSGNEMGSTESSSMTTMTDGPETSVDPLTTTAANVDPISTTQMNLVDSTTRVETTSDSSVTSSPATSEDPESNTIQQADVTSTEATTRLTDAPTTEAESNNIVDAETTTIPSVTATVRTRLIDFAQDILSRLQETISTTTIPVRDFTTISPEIEISNVIADSNRDNTLDILAQLRDVETTTTTTTTRSSASDAMESTTMQTVQGELRETTTTSSVTTDQVSLRTTDEISTQSAVGLSTTSSPTTDQPNTMIPTQETNTQDDVNSVITTTQDSQIASSTDSTNVVGDSNTRMLLDEQLTPNAESLNNTVQNSENASDPTFGNGITTESMITSTDDTLLTELMSIAKTLLSEEVNDAQNLSNDTTTPIDDLDSSTESENLTESIVSTTQAPVSSLSPSDVTTESTSAPSIVTTELSPATIETTTESAELITSSIDPTQNEVESDLNPSTTPLSVESTTSESNTTPESIVVRNETEVVQQTQTTPLEPTFENLESTAPPTTATNEPQTSLSNTTTEDTEIGPETTTKTQTTTQSTETTATSIINFELTTNTYDLRSSNLMVTTETQTSSGQTTEAVIESTEQTMSLTNSTTVTAESVTETANTNQFESTTAFTVPETILSRVNTFTSASSDSTESNVLETTVATTETSESIANDTSTVTNQAAESVTELTPNNTLTTMVSNIESLETTTSTLTTTSLDVTAMDVAEVTTNQPFLTNGVEPANDVASNPPTTTTTITNEAITNLSTEQTTNIPQTTSSIENDTPTIVAPFQDATSATAQGTAGSGIGQTTEINNPMITESSTIPSSPNESSTPSSPDSNVITTTTISSSAATTVPPTTTTETTTTTTTVRPADTGTTTTTTESARADDVFTVTAISQTTVPTAVTGADINENLISTEATTDVSATTTVSAETLNPISRIDTSDAAMDSMNSTSTEGTATTTPAPESTTVSSTEATSRMTMPTVTASSMDVSQNPTTPYLGRFGGSRLTPAPRFSPSSSTKAPLRDYLIYGIYPNKTIVRKRPEDNLIDARNVDSPYVIFGIFPDGRLVRKFPNGTIIPDPPRSPVEVVFSLSTTTTTNRPPPRPYYNQANQGTYNQYQAPAYDNNRRPIAELIGNVQSPGTFDLGLTGNAIAGPNGGGPDFTGSVGIPASVATATKMSDVLLNTRMGTTPNVVSAIAGLLTPIASTGRPPADSSQGGRIVQDRERDEATRTKEAGGQRSSVYIGQDKFVNYWTDGAPNTNPRVVSVKIDSVASALNEGSSPSGSLPSFPNLSNDQSGGQVTAPPGFPWRDPLDQIFGITTSSPVITASVASNSLDDSADPNGSILGRPINPFVEVFTPVSSPIGIARTTTTSTATTTTTTTTTMMPTTTTTTTTTTTAAPTTTTTTTTTTMAPATTTTTSTMAPTTTAATVDAAGAATPETAGTAVPATTPTNVQGIPLTNTQSQNAFGTSFDDLAFLNSLLQTPGTGSTTQKTLTQVEELLANKILSLALNNPGPPRSAKAIGVANASPNSLVQSPTRSPSVPIVIDLFPSSTATPPTWKPAVTQQQTSPKPVESSLAPVQVTWKPVPTSTTKRDTVPSTTAVPTAKTTLISTTKAPVVITAKTITTQRPRTTTAQAPLGFGASLWQAIFNGNLFGPSTTQRPIKPVAKPTKSTPKSVNITPKPVAVTQKTIQATQKPVESVQSVQVTSKPPSSSTPQTVNISKIQVVSPNAIAEAKQAIQANFASTTKQPLLNNPNPRLQNVETSTYSPEEDAKFLAALLRAVQADSKASGSKQTAISSDEESFLRAILSGQAPKTTTPPPSPEINNAALLAALLKAQGIEPPTPANDIRQQLQLASLGQSVTSAPSGSTTTGPTTITTRPASTATRPTVTTKKPVTPGPTSRPRPRTTTWTPSSTYPPPLFSSFANYGTPSQGSDNSGNGGLFGATRAFSQFLGAAITGAAQQLQSFVRNGTRIVSEAVG